MSYIIPYSPAIKVIATSASGFKADYYTDGTSDDVQIQAAIDALSSTGGRVLLRKGTYTITAKISLANSLVLEGEGEQSIIKQADSTNIDNTLLEASGMTNVVIRDLKIDGNKTNNASFGRGITIRNSSYCYIANVTVTETRDHAINIRETSNYNIVENCNCLSVNGAGVVISNGASYNKVLKLTTKTATNSGVYITSSNFNEAFNCYSEDTYYGFDIFDSTDCYMEGCRAVNPDFDQFHIEDSQDVSYVKCEGYGGRDGLAIYSTALSSKLSTNIILIGCNFKAATHYGVNLIGTASLGISSVLISDCNITDSTAYGIYGTYTTGLVIAGNIIDGNGGVTYDGIRLDVGLTSCTIAENQIINNGARPIRIHDATVDNVQIYGNTYSGNGVNTILNNSTGTVSSINPNLDIVFDPTSARQIITSRSATGTGTNLTIEAGGALPGGTNTDGGALILASGIATGSARSAIRFHVPISGTSGTTEITPTWNASIWAASANGPIISTAATSTTTGLPLASNAFALRGTAPGGLTAYRHTTADTQGNNLTIQAGGATLNATNKSGGSLLLKSGISTGTGNSQILLQTAGVGTTGTTDNAFTTRATINSTGMSITGALTLSTALAVAQGGTGATTLTGILKGNGTSAVTGSATLNDVGTPTTSFSMGSQKITSLADPASNQDAATKFYVDSVAQGLDAKASCRVATTANITLSGTQTIDSVALSIGDRVLVKNQTTGSENGIYDVASGSWTRSTDADTDAEVTTGLFTFITGGSTQANTGWVLTTANPITLGSTSLTFAQFSAAASVVAGNGLTLTGNTLDVVGTTDRITANADSLDIAATYVGQASITTLGTITTGVWTGSTVGLAYGGTGATTASDARSSLGLGSLAIQNASTVNISGGDITGITDLAVADGGTGASTAANARTNLGLGSIATQASTSVSITGGSITGITDLAVTDGGTGASDAATARTNLGLGSISTQSAASVSITGGTITGITDLNVSEGGTGASTAPGAFSNLAPTTTEGDMIYRGASQNERLPKGTANQMLRMNSGATAPEWYTGANRNLVELGSDVPSTASTSFQDITGMSFSVTSGVNYRFYALLCYTASASSIGLRVSLTSPAVTLRAYRTKTAPGGTSGGVPSAGTDNSWENWQVSADSGTSSGASMQTTGGNIIILEGFIRPSASGTVQLRFAPETATASGIIIKAGSTLEYW